MAKKINLDDLFEGSPKPLEQYTKAIEQLIKAVEQLTSTVNAKKKDVNDFVTAFANANPNTKEGIDLINKLTKEYGDYAKLVKQIEKLEKQLATAKEQLNKVDKEGLRAKVELAEARRKARQDIKDEIKLQNAATDSLEAEEVQLKKLRQEYAKLGKAQKETSTSAKQMKAEIDRLTDSTKKQRAEMGQHQADVGNYGKALQGIGGNFVKMAGTLGVVTTGLEAANLAFQKITSLNKDLKTTQSILAGTGEDVQAVTAAISALSSTFGEDFNEILRTTNTLSKEFGEGQEGVLDGLNELFAQNANISGDLLDNLREYAPQLKRAGASLEDLNRIALVSARSGFFNDKLYDTVKEGMLRIAEASEDANSTYAKSIRSLGAVGNEILKTFQSGDKLGAIQKLSAEIVRLEESGVSAQKPLSELFGSPGEDLGVRGLKVLSTLNDVNMQLSETEKRSIALTKANERLNLQLIKLGEGFGGLGTTIQTGFLNFLSDALTGLNTFGDRIEIAFNGIRGSSKAAQESLLLFGETESGKKISDILDETFGDANATKVTDFAERYAKFVNAFKAEGEELDDINALFTVFNERHLKAADAAKKLKEEEEAAVKAAKDAAQNEAYSLKLAKDRELALKLKDALRALNEEIDNNLTATIDPAKALEKFTGGGGDITTDLSGIIEDPTKSIQEKNKILALREEEEALKAATEQRDKYMEAFEEQMQRSAETQRIREEEIRLNNEMAASLTTIALEQIAYSNSFGEYIENVTKAAIKSLAPMIAQFAAKQLSSINLPPPAGLVLAGGVVGAAATFLSRIRSFKDGVFDVGLAKEYTGEKGISHPLGKKGVDVIPAWLNEGETVVQDDQTVKYSNSLEAIVSKRGDAAVLKGILQDIGKSEEVLSKTKHAGQSVNYAAITAATREGIRRGMAEQTQHITTFNEGEMQRYIRKSGSITRLKNKRNGF